MCVVFYSSFVCISAYANVYFKTTLRECLRAGLPPGFPSTAPPPVRVSAVLGTLDVWITKKNLSVCVPDVLGALAGCANSKPKKKKTAGYEVHGQAHSCCTAYGKSCVLSQATQNLRCLLNSTQVQQVQSALISSLQRILHCLRRSPCLSWSSAQITMLELGIPLLSSSKLNNLSPSTSKRMSNDLITTLSTLLTHCHQPTWNSFTLCQQTSIILADPPTTLPEHFHQTWLHATLHHILTYIAALDTHVYNMSHALQPP